MSAHTPSPIIGVGILLLNPEGQVLLGRRIKATERPSWCLPGGKVDLGERFEQAGARELLEETDLQLEATQLQAFCLLNNTAASRCNSTVGLYAQIQASDLQQIKVTEPHIFAEWQWFDLDQLPSELFAETGAMLTLWLKQALDPQWSAYRLAV